MSHQCINMRTVDADSCIFNLNLMEVRRQATYTVLVLSAMMTMGRPQHLEEQPPQLEERRRIVVSGQRRVAFIFNAAAMLYNAHAICAIQSALPQRCCRVGRKREVGQH